MNAKSGAPKPSEILGIPRLPPAKVTGIVNSIRGWIGRVHLAMAPPPVQILESLFGILDHRVMVLMCSAGIPDAVTSPMSIEDLARRVNADPERLERIVRFAVARGWLRLDRRGRVRSTRVSEFLRTDHPGGWLSWVQFAGGDEVVNSIAHLGLESGDAFAKANVKSFFEWMRENPTRWAIFDEAMSAGARMHALTINSSMEWGQNQTVCDIGGGTGEFLIGILELQPTMNGIVFDLPGVISRARSHKRLTSIAGDMFVTVPAGCDVYFLVNVIHDWNDDDAGKIFSNIVSAAVEHSQVLVIDNDHPRRPRRDIATSADVLMAALTNGGKERDRQALQLLAEKSGLRLISKKSLASGDSLYVLKKK